MPDGRLLVCDAERGLLAVDPGTGTTETLVTDVGGARMRFCNNAAVAPDGTVYFSDSSRRFGVEHWKAEMLEHSGTGRLLRRNPSGAVELLLDGLEFSNGVALSPDGSTVVVAETGASRLTRLHLTGPRQGQAELFADLAAYPDNVSTGTDGLLWVAMPSPRKRLLDRLARSPALARLAWSAPEALQPKPMRMAWVTAWTFDGDLVHDLQGAHRDFWMSVGVREHRGTVHLGSLVTPNVASFVVPAVPRAG
jgi:sugar lactone lactonase YvrE